MVWRSVSDRGRSEQQGGATARFARLPLMATTLSDSTREQMQHQDQVEVYRPDCKAQRKPGAPQSRLVCRIHKNVHRAYMANEIFVVMQSIGVVLVRDLNTAGEGGGEGACRNEQGAGGTRFIAAASFRLGGPELFATSPPLLLFSSLYFLRL